MGKTIMFYNQDFHKQPPLRFSDCMEKSVNELLSIFHIANYRRNTGTFLMTDSLAKNLDAEYVGAADFERIAELKPDTIITNALHCFSPRFVFDRKYWQTILDFGAKVVPMTLGFRYHENGEFFLTDDMVYILAQIAERNEIGVRGEYVAQILNGYGIKNVRIVGCPSLFYNMDHPTIVTEAKNTPIKSIDFNFNGCYGDFFYNHKEFCTLLLPIFHYAYDIYKQGKVQVNYNLQTGFLKELITFGNFTHFPSIKPFVMEMGRYFFSVDDWINALKLDDFSIGTQFHGSVAAILAGVPALMVAVDKRMEELARYHKIPYLLPEKFDPEKPLEYYYEHCDYSEFNKSYMAAYNNFVDYCTKNGVHLKI